MLKQIHQNQWEPLRNSPSTKQTPNPKPNIQTPRFNAPNRFKLPKSKPHPKFCPGDISGHHNFWHAFNGHRLRNHHHRCHCIKMKNPRWANKKTRKPKVKFLSNWRNFIKIQLLPPKNPTFFRKKNVLSTKILMTFSSYFRKRTDNTTLWGHPFMTSTKKSGFHFFSVQRRNSGKKDANFFA